ncbi:MAG: BON domain-containing protein, partial [Anaerolineae bacterium]
MVLGISDVRKRVEAALEEDERTADYAIEVIDQDGLITLKGEVSSAEDKQAAEDIASAQEGVIAVTNALVVVGEGDELVGTIESGEDEDSGVIVAPVTSSPTTGPPSGSTVAPHYVPGVVVSTEE